MHAGHTKGAALRENEEIIISNVFLRRRLWASLINARNVQLHVFLSSVRWRYSQSLKYFVTHQIVSAFAGEDFRVGQEAYP